MDPDANLEEQLLLANRILHERDIEGITSPEDVARLAELVLSNDAWIRAGGFLPKDWQKNPSQST